MARTRLRGPSKDLKSLLQAVQERGWEVKRRNNKHLVLIGPEGQKVFTSSTPSDHRVIMNIKRDLKRAGLVL